MFYLLVYWHISIHEQFYQNEKMVSRAKYAQYLNG